MKYIIPFALLFVFAACKKDDPASNSVHEPVPGLQTISSLTQINNEVATGVSMVFFHASWCEVCQAQRPAVSEVATDTDLSTVFFGEVEYDDHPDIIQEYGVQGFPTIIIFKDGSEVDRFTGGGHAAASIKLAIEPHL